MIGAGRFLFALVSPRWPCVKLSCNKGLCASGCFFVVTTSFTLAGLYSLALKVDVLPLPRPAHWAADVVKGRPPEKKTTGRGVPRGISRCTESIKREGTVLTEQFRGGPWFAVVCWQFRSGSIVRSSVAVVPVVFRAVVSCGPAVWCSRGGYPLVVVSGGGPMQVVVLGGGSVMAVVVVHGGVHGPMVFMSFLTASTSSTAR